MADAEVVYEGGCSCGAVRYRLQGPPFKVGVCHCTSCRKETGSVFMPYGDWKAEQFSFTGPTRIWEGRSFCIVCGSRLFSPSPEHVEIKLGTLDAAPTDLVPTVEGWIKRREPWLAPIEGASQHREDPQ